MTASLLAWGAIHAATPDTDLRPGVHGPVAAFGLDTLTLGATESGYTKPKSQPFVVEQRPGAQMMTAPNKRPNPSRQYPLHRTTLNRIRP
jgi:hypothetical protein